MIKSTKQGTYGDARTGLKTSIIHTAIISYSSDLNGRTYTLENYLVNEEGARVLYGSQFPKYMNNQELSDLDNYLETSGIKFTKIVNNEIVELRGNEREWAKIKYGLLYYVKSDFLKDEQGNNTEYTVFMLKPEDWELI